MGLHTNAVTATSSTVQHRVAYLDGLRGVAILAVIAVHWRHGFQWFIGGSVGVDVFFVLSGYLITGILIRRRPSYGAFMLARARRLLPALAGAIAAGLLLCLLLPDPPVSAAEAFAGALVTGLQLTSISRPGWDFAATPWSVSWSLAAEWYFYAAWPAIVAAVGRRTWSPQQARNRLLVGAGIVYGGSMLLSGSWFYYGPSGRFAELVVGGALAYHQLCPRPEHTGRGRQVAACVLGAAAVAWVVIGTGGTDAAYRWIGLPVAVAWTCSVIVLAMSEPGAALIRGLAFKPLAALGRISYSVYLWHYLPLAFLANTSFGLPKPVALGGCMILVAAASIASYRWLEKPFIRPHAATPPVIDVRTSRKTVAPADTSGV
ncbi:hypothetical protein Kisp01_27570 [Kineosporia sp. NBRC 101677]|uniref:acyltransferase family protein n=1 Tax=Kineosporia sp. NBRC 101677 TaxID=3032197 RepID=UPI0024A54435|nr:acyltransferase [Kineosporia sp. NBRC 101677]GLY15742.1 hypothetical protein Kisp01_27570 [Kineosporia sp. NBRC 101677]